MGQLALPDLAVRRRAKAQVRELREQSPHLLANASMLCCVRMWEGTFLDACPSYCAVHAVLMDRVSLVVS